jgi:hypothetical protein
VDLLPWLIGVWIVFGRKPAAVSSSQTSTTSPPPRTVPLVAYLYQLPGDGYETVRVAVGQQPEGAIDKTERPVEMGIFSNEAEALRLVVQPKGYALAWPGVRQLEERP